MTAFVKNACDVLDYLVDVRITPRSAFLPRLFGGAGQEGEPLELNCGIGSNDGVPQIERLFVVSEFRQASIFKVLRPAELRVVKAGHVRVENDGGLTSLLNEPTSDHAGGMVLNERLNVV